MENADSHKSRAERFNQAFFARVSKATREAYWDAMRQNGKLIEARNGFIVETSASGESKVLRCLPLINALPAGSKRFRLRQSDSPSPV